MPTDDCYELLREFASPVVAITSSWNGRTNGMISDSVLRASISPRVPRLSVYIHKWHFSHELIWNSGRFGLHLLHRGQLDLVHRLGFASGRDGNKLSDVPHRLGQGGVPVLQDCYAAFECQVINTMDTGYATHYLANVVDFHPGHGQEILTPAWLRANLPASWKEAFLENYRVAQEQIDQNAAIQDRRWMGPVPS
ncbi:MAG: flavin reductase family protein [Gemmatimonadales bacterium]